MVHVYSIFPVYSSDFQRQAVKVAKRTKKKKLEGHAAGVGSSQESSKKVLQYSKNADLLNSTIDQSTILDGESLSPQRMKHLNMNNQSQ